MNYKEALEEVGKIVDDLIEENKKVPIIVEGEKDVAALRKLGINGKIIRINSGKSLTDFCDRLADFYEEIIILTDWDRRGGILCAIIKRNLRGRVKCNLEYRERFARCITIRKVEGIPSWIETLRRRLKV